MPAFRVVNGGDGEITLSPFDLFSSFAASSALGEPSSEMQEIIDHLLSYGNYQDDGDLRRAFATVLDTSFANEPPADFRKPDKIICPTCMQVHLPVEGTENFNLSVGATNDDEPDEDSMPPLEDIHTNNENASHFHVVPAQNLFVDGSDSPTREDVHISDEESHAPYVTAQDLFDDGSDSDCSSESSMPSLYDERSTDDLTSVGPPTREDVHISDEESRAPYVTAQDLFDDDDDSDECSSESSMPSLYDDRSYDDLSEDSSWVDDYEKENGSTVSEASLSRTLTTGAVTGLQREVSDDEEEREVSEDSEDDEDSVPHSYYTQPGIGASSVSSESVVSHDHNRPDHGELKILHDYGAIRVFACATCPICLEESNPVVALSCGHCLCEDDFKRMGGYLASDKENLRQVSIRAEVPSSIMCSSTRG